MPETTDAVCTCAADVLARNWPAWLPLLAPLPAEDALSPWVGLAHCLAGGLGWVLTGFALFCLASCVWQAGRGGAWRAADGVDLYHEAGNALRAALGLAALGGGGLYVAAPLLTAAALGLSGRFLLWPLARGVRVFWAEGRRRRDRRRRGLDPVSDRE